MAGIYSNLPYVTSKICLGNLNILFRRHLPILPNDHTTERILIPFSAIFFFFLSHCVETECSGGIQMFAFIDNILIKAYESFAYVGYIYASWSYPIFEKSQLVQIGQKIFCLV